MAEITVNPLVTDLLRELKKRNVSVAKFAKEAKIPKGRIYKWNKEGNNPKYEDVSKINKWLGKTTMEKSIHGDERDATSLVNDPDKKYGNDTSPLQAVIHIAASNKVLAEANLKLADAHKILAKNNQDLITMIKPTVNDGQQIPEVVAARFSGLLELLAQVGSGKKWKSVEEARAALSKLILVPGETG